MAYIFKKAELPSLILEVLGRDGTFAFDAVADDQYAA